MTVPVPSSRHQSEYHDLEDVYPRDRSKSPPRTPARYFVDSKRNSSPTVPNYFGEVKYSQGFSNVPQALNPADIHKRHSDWRDYYPHLRQ